MSFTISINDQAAFEVQFAGPAGPTGPQGIQGIQGVPGPGVAAGGTTGQVLKKLSSTNYDTGWSSDISGVAWGAITGTLSSQTDLQSALDAKLSTSAASSTYLPKAGGYITGDILSSNGSGLYSSNGASTYTNVSASGIAISGGSGPGSGAMSINWDGITFVSSPYKQTQPFLGLAGYATESWVTAGFYPLTGNPSGFLVAADLAGYATESWVTGQLGSYLPLAGGAMTGSITSAGTTYDTEMAGDFFGVQLSADHTQGTMVNFDGLHTYDGPNSVYVKPTGITFPDATMQTTAYTGTSPTAWGSITGTLSDQTDLQSALDAKYDASNPAGFVDSAYVTGLGYITQGTADGLYYSISNPSGFVTAGDLSGYALLSGASFNGRVRIGTPSDTTAWLTIEGAKQSNSPGIYSARVNFGTSSPNVPLTGDLWFDGSNFKYGSSGSPFTFASQSWVNSQAYITSSALAPYAQLAGSTFTGKIILTPGSTIAPLNIGTGYTPASTTAGDVWMGTNTISYKDGANLVRTLSVNGLTNAFSAPQIIDTTATTAALRVTQKGTGNAIEVEDSTSPDATRFVVDQFGKVGVGVAPDATAAIKIDGNGISFNGLVFNPTATSAHTGGSDTLDLLVTINGTNYRLGLRPA